MPSQYCVLEEVAGAGILAGSRLAKTDGPPAAGMAGRDHLIEPAMKPRGSPPCKKRLQPDKRADPRLFMECVPKGWEQGKAR